MAYAEEVNLPFEKMYDAKGAKILFYFNSTDVRVMYWFDYTFPIELIEAMPSPIDSPSDYEHMKAVEIFIEEQKEAILKTITEESLAKSTDDRERIVADRPPLLHETAAMAKELCFGGTEVQQQIHFENETLNIAQEFDGNIRTDINKMREAQNSEFCIAYQKARSMGFDFAEIQNSDPVANIGLDTTQMYRDQRTATPDIVEQSLIKAQATIDKSPHLRSMNQTGFDFTIPEHKFPEVRTLCMTNPATYELMCPLQLIDDYFAENPDVAPEVQAAASENAALVIACADAWDRTDNGKRNIDSWEPMLLDQTCVKHIPNLWTLRFEATR